LTPASIIPVFGSQRPYADLNFAGGSFGLDGRSVSNLTALPGFTFTRASLAMGYDATGKLTYGPNNQALQSQTFDNASWAKTNATVTANAVTAPDGTATADKLVEAATVGAHYVGQTLAPVGIPAVASVYAKAGERTQLAIQLGSSSAGYFNLSNGTVVSGASAGISDAGNGWYRCWVSGTPSNQNFLLYTAVAGSVSYSGDSTSGIFIWGAQLEAVTYQTTPSTYYPTTTAAYYGPRLVYDPVTLASLGILVEEARTNLLLQSQDFATTWTQDAVTVTANSTTSPDGTSNADKVIETATTANHRFRQIVTVSNATAYTYSVFIKAGERTWAFVEVISGATDVFCYVNLSTGALGGTINGTWTVTGVGNGWYRVSCTFTTATTTAQAFNQLSTGNGVTSYAGDGTSGAFFWQAQLELGTGASSPVPTTTAAVTRAADVAAVTGLTVTTPLTIVSSGGMTAATSTTRYMAQVDAGSSANIVLNYLNSSGIRRAFVQTASVTQADVSVSTAVAVGDQWTIASRFQTDNVRPSTAGVLGTADTSATVPTGLVNLRIGTDSVGGQFNGTISRIRIFNRGLSDAQLQSLTA
jgi:hypothetical protein